MQFFVLPLCLSLFSSYQCVLGSAAIMSNGAVQGRCGTAAVAMAAHKKNVPVIFTCETYKLCDKVIANHNSIVDHC